MLCIHTNFGLSCTGRRVGDLDVKWLVKGRGASQEERQNGRDRRETHFVCYLLSIVICNGNVL
jgi:hypothetical protein